MQEELNTKRVSMLIPFIVGSIVGAGIALLLSPKAGRELRSGMKDYATLAKGKLTGAIDDSTKLYEETKTAVKSALEAGTAAFKQERGRHQQAA